MTGCIDGEMDTLTIMRAFSPSGAIVLCLSPSQLLTGKKKQAKAAIGGGLLLKGFVVLMETSDE